MQWLSRIWKEQIKYRKVTFEMKNSVEKRIEWGYFSLDWELIVARREWWDSLVFTSIYYTITRTASSPSTYHCTGPTASTSPDIVVDRPVWKSMKPPCVVLVLNGNSYVLMFVVSYTWRVFHRQWLNHIGVFVVETRRKFILWLVCLHKENWVIIYVYLQYIIIMKK
jgi:hypothetical protein